MLTRFAPAPTGWLHLGHVANALHVWGVARRLSLGVLLRIEDHDRQRSRPEYETGLLDDLDWLGFTPDVFPTEAFRAGACSSRQSERGGLYTALVETLSARGLVYGCDCSRTQLGPAPGDGAERPYPGTCRTKGLAITAATALRIRLGDNLESFEDLWRGRISQRPSDQCGDPLIRDRHGNWTYQFACAADDHLQRIDLVVRGLDLVDSTARQIAIGRLLGRITPARFGHHPLVMKSATQKLSKSDGDTGIRELRGAGLSRKVILEEAARRVGLLSDTRPTSAVTTSDFVEAIAEGLLA